MPDGHGSRINRRTGTSASVQRDKARDSAAASAAGLVASLAAGAAAGSSGSAAVVVVAREAPAQHSRQLQGSCVDVSTVPPSAAAATNSS